MKTIRSLIMAIAILMTLAGRMRDATVASRNLSKEADQFKVRRLVIFYNAITDVIMFEMTGNLSIDTSTVANELAVTGKIGGNEYRKHFLGLSDNVTYIVEQVESKNVSEYKYDLVFKPEIIIPVSIDME